MLKINKGMILSWILVLVWMGIIFSLSAQVRDESNSLSKGVTEIIIETVEEIVPEADLDIDRVNHILRKNAHFFTFLVLGILVLNAMRRSGIYGVKWAFLICVIYAISDEIHQAFVPGRGPQAKDVFIDSVGVMVGLGIYLSLSFLKKPIHKTKYRQMKIG